MSQQQFPIIGYYQQGHKWLPVTVNEEGKILFQQDPQTVLALAQMKLTIDTLAQYVHDSKGEIEAGINEALATMQNTINNATNQMLDINTHLSDEEIGQIINTVW